MLFILFGLVAMSTCFIEFVIFGRGGHTVNPILVLGSALFNGGLACAGAYHWLKQRNKVDASPRRYTLPPEQMVDEVRALYEGPIAELNMVQNWDEMRESRQGKPDRDGTMTLTFECFYRDVIIRDRNGYPTLIEDCVLQQDVLIQPDNGGTIIEVIFYLKTGGYGETGPNLERATRDYFNQSLSNCERRS